MEPDRGLSLKATGWVLAVSQRSLQRGPDSALLSGQEVQGPLQPGAGKGERMTETEHSLLCAEDGPGLSFGRTRKTFQEEKSQQEQLVLIDLLIYAN